MLHTVGPRSWRRRRDAGSPGERDALDIA